ncbi:hypothetical protein OU415_11605 [Saccharopolyspora sp. WRP15-2]|uniref:Mandelate racemase/muconate lactonizing enzyme C-terminal domain-containing protein n=1 Tax=Saccharopolyspora oryzae TaxID=2997343 RepID=A0ABT4UWI0_9PSEU|nr:enolase C-terminal domain-like protein [Saccharopolyspora oryzae]MDA3626082.1 hypothetical protein [Saccharopolyspora oryzae]
MPTSRPRNRLWILAIEEVVDRAAESVAGGIKIKVGHPDHATDLARVSAVREKIGDRVALMVDANQQRGRSTARRMCRALEPLDLVWIEEPLDAYDFAGHAVLASTFDTSIATGEMLTSAAEHAELIRAGGADVVQPDAPRVGGITRFLKVMALADSQHLQLAPHFAMEIHVHLAAAYARTVGRALRMARPAVQRTPGDLRWPMHISLRPGLGVTISDRARAWTVAEREVRA